MLKEKSFWFGVDYPGKVYAKIREDEILEGAIDMHLHIGPIAIPRRYDGLTFAREARNVGMRAVVYKPLRHFSTIQMANLVEKLVPGIRVFGGVVLNSDVGGVNPCAARSAIDLGGKVIWMPTIDSAHTVKKSETVEFYRKKRYTPPEIGEGIGVLKNGELTPEAREVIALVAEAKDVVLNTGHLSAQEALAVVDEAKNVGVRFICTNHVHAPVMDYSIEEQKELARKGVYLEYVWFNCLPIGETSAYKQTPAHLANMIKKVGPEHVIMGTDLGQPIEVSPIEGLRSFILHMLNQGLSKKEIDLMVRENPAKILGL